MAHTPAPLIFRPNSDSGCSECALNPVCLPPAVSDGELNALDSIIQRTRPLRRSEHLFHEQEGFQALYAVRSGAIKAYTTQVGGEEQVIGFYLPGEIVGMDGIGSGRHMSSALALETTAVCAIPFNHLEELARQIPSLQHHFFRLLSQEIQADQQLMLLLSKRSAEERIASLILSLSARHKRRRLSESQFRLPMARADIANYLGLAVETVSRIFTRFQQLDVLAVEGKDITILDRARLCELATLGPEQAASRLT